MTRRRLRWTRERYRKAAHLSRYFSRHVYDLPSDPPRLLERYWELWQAHPQGEDQLLRPLSSRLPARLVVLRAIPGHKAALQLGPADRTMAARMSAIRSGRNSSASTAPLHVHVGVSGARVEHHEQQAMAWAPAAQQPVTEAGAAADDGVALRAQNCRGFECRDRDDDRVTLGGGPPGDPNGEQAALAVEVLVRKYEGAMLRETLREALTEAYMMGAQNVLGRM